MEEGSRGGDELGKPIQPNRRRHVPPPIHGIHYDERLAKPGLQLPLPTPVMFRMVNDHPSPIVCKLLQDVDEGFEVEDEEFAEVAAEPSHPKLRPIRPNPLHEPLEKANLIPQLWVKMF